MNFLKLFQKEGSIMIVATIAVVVISALSASLVMQIQSDTTYTQFVRHQTVATNIVKGAVYESIAEMVGGGDGMIGVAGWNPLVDDTDGDGFPSFILPGEAGASENGVNPADGDGIVSFGGNVQFEGRYAVFVEDLGANGVDDNRDTVVDDPTESNFRRIWAIARYGNATKRVRATIGQQITTSSVSEAFFKAIYAGNESEDPNYYLDLGGTVKQGKDDIEGDIYVRGNIRLHDNALTWKTESYTDSNGNGQYDLGEPIADFAGQEPGFYNLGTEAATVEGAEGTTGNINLRSNIGTKNWKTKDPTIGGTPGNMSEDADQLAPPDFQVSLDSVTIDVGAEIDANGSSYTITNSGGYVHGLTVNDVNNPAHLFTRANAGQDSAIASYYADSAFNGLDNYIIRDSTGGNGETLSIAPNGNNQVYLIPGNLLFGQEDALRMYFVPTPSSNPSDPLRVTFLVQGNIVINDDFVYRASSPYEMTDANWNPYDDAFALVALKNDAAPGNSGNIEFADKGSKTLERIDGYLYAENDFTSIYGQIDKHDRGVQVNGMMSAGNHVRFNQEYTGGEWKARPDSQRNQFFINFDPRIREILNDAEWLPGLPGGANRTLPVAGNGDWNRILSWDES